MELKQLRALITVAETGSVTRAAELLDLVQPAVTRQIRTLEDEIGVALFERSRQGMRLTEAGEVMADRARRIFNDLKHTLMSVQPRPDEVTGTVAVGLLESTAGLIGPALAAALRRDQAGIDLRLTVASSRHLKEWLDEGALDVSVLYDVDNALALSTHPLVRDNLWVVAPTSARLRPDVPLPLMQAAQHPLVLPSSGFALRTLIDRAAVAADVAIDIAVETNSLHLQKQLVVAGLGWTVLPGVAVAGELANGTLSAAPVCAPDIWRSLVVARQAADRTPLAVRVVTATLVRLGRSAMRKGHWQPHQHTVVIEGIRCPAPGPRGKADCRHRP